MVKAVRFHFDDREWEVRFGHPQAKLPVRDRTGNVVLKPWGRRPNEKGKLPLGGFARQTHLQGNRWDCYFPKSVRVMVKGFLVLDVADNEHWLIVTPGQFIHGICARYDAELRIYLVTHDSPPDMAEFEMWPKIMNGL